MAEIIKSNLLTSRQAADRLRIKKNTLCEWRRKGQGPAYYQLGGRIYYAAHDVDSYIARARRPGRDTRG